MNEVLEKENIKIEDIIYEIRGVQVMLANIDELSLRSQFVTLNKSNNLRGQHFKYLPYVLTEPGIMMLSGLLRSDIAVKVNIQIIDAFVKLRKYVSTSLIEQKYINDLVLENSKRIDLIEETLSNFKEKNNHIFFEGQIYDAYSIMLDIFNTAKNNIIIIDNYIDKNILDILSKTNKRIILITNNYNNEDYNKYKEQYSNINLVINNKIHDRFIILDKKTLYHCGASFKDLGKKCFAITKIDDDNILNNLLENL